MTTYRLSAKLRFVILIEGEGSTSYSDSVYLLRATDSHDARDRALMLGRSREESYLNADKQRVARRFVSVETLDERE